MERILARFGLNVVDEDWIKSTWMQPLQESQFHMDLPEPNLKDMIRLTDFLKGNTISVEDVPKELLSYLAVVTAKLAEWNSPSDEDIIRDGPVVLRSIEAYLRLLSIERAAAFNIFHPLLFEQSWVILQTVITKEHSAIKNRRKKPDHETIMLSAVEDVIAVLGVLFENFILTRDHADRAISTFAYLINSSASLFLETSPISFMLYHLLGQNIKTEVFPICIRILNHKLLPLKSSSMNLTERRCFDIVLHACEMAGKRKNSFFYALIRILVSQSHDKNSTREAIDEVMTKFFPLCDIETQLKIISFIKKNMETKKVSQRALSVGVLKRILYHIPSQELQEKVDASMLFSKLARRCRDSNHTVAARAMFSLAELLEGCILGPTDSLMAPGALQPSYLRRLSTATANRLSVATSQVSTTSSNMTTNSLFGIHRFSDHATMTEASRSTLQKTFCLDSDGLSVLQQMQNSKYQLVRKSVILLTKALVIRQFASCEEKVWQIFARACRDPLLSVRQVAVAAFTNLMNALDTFDHPSGLNNSMMESTRSEFRLDWLNVMLDALEDPERAVKEVAFNGLYLNFITVIIETGNHEMWNCLDLVSGNMYEPLKNNLIALFEQAKSDEKVSSFVPLAKNAMRRLEIQDGESGACWILLKVIYQLEKDSIAVMDVLTVFKEHIEHLMKDAACVSAVAFELVIELAENELGENMRQDLLDFVSSILKILCPKNLNVIEPLTRLIRICAGDGLKDWLSGRFSIREMARRVNKVGDESLDPFDYMSNCGTLIITVLFYSEFLEITPADDRDEFAQYLNMVFFKDFKGVLNTPLPTELMTALIHVLGNLCIRRGKNSEDLVRIFIYSLSDRANCASIRIVALSIVADLCVVKTHLVDRFMDILAALLEDNDETVQIATMQHLTNLLKKDFIRMKPSILTRMLILAADPEPRSKIVHQKASFCLRQVLKPRNPKIFQENFIAVMILSTGAFSIDPSHDRRLQISTQTQRSTTFETGAFPGIEGRARRMQIYTFCICNMSEEQRLTVFCNITNLVLAIPLLRKVDITSVEMTEVFFDALHLLYRHQMLQFQLVGPKNARNAEQDHFDDEPLRKEGMKRAAFLETCAKTRIQFITKQTFPILVDLRNELKTVRSPLLPTIGKLCQAWLKEIPGLKESDIMYRNLQDDLSEECALWANDDNPIPAPAREDAPGTPATPIRKKSKRSGINQNVSISEQVAEIFSDSEPESDANIENTSSNMTVLEKSVLQIEKTLGSGEEQESLLSPAQQNMNRRRSRRSSLAALSSNLTPIRRANPDHEATHMTPK
ncbi:Oidioi.mRNA.OKI2018_I69.XSR.g15913.t1.cds [Oikopleura dioica]|uniref:Oidioi.mRNA.OKI2018_I69.XSR.g15913.t1.cds n=1 Tax=Oikopleura dioica TaxID=34765 RepID=A0ABN7SNP1_OIKDI|nr:Oidioi.mRNA.OKI2018_I69.XSR.g15913.t1.cds [Oikopleura dioica]